jgi:uncharacterized membrane protein
LTRPRAQGTFHAVSTDPILPVPRPPLLRQPLLLVLRDYLLTGLLALAPSVITLYVFIRMLNWMDGLLGRYLRFSFVDYRRIPGLGLIATLILLVFVGWFATVIGRWIGGRSVMAMWETVLTRIPGVGILYGSTKSLGEAFFTRKQDTFKHVVLVPWPHPGIFRIGFVAGRSTRVNRVLGGEYQAVFIPHTPNPASGFVHYVPDAQLVYLDWAIEDGLKVIISGGSLQPGEPTAKAQPPVADPGEIRAS